jgi:hypothetical protein
MKLNTFVYCFLFLLSGYIIPGLPESRSNVCPDNHITGLYNTDVFQVELSENRTFGFRQAIPYKPLREKYPENAGKSKPLSNQSILKVGYRIIADRGPEPAVIVLSRVLFECWHITNSSNSHLSFPLTSSKNGSSLKIRPPPEL